MREVVIVTEPAEIDEQVWPVPVAVGRTELPSVNDECEEVTETARVDMQVHLPMSAERPELPSCDGETLCEVDLTMSEDASQVHGWSEASKVVMNSLSTHGDALGVLSTVTQVEHSSDKEQASQVGVPLELHCAPGRNILSMVPRKECELLIDDGTVITPLHSRLDGMVECVNRTVGKYSSHIKVKEWISANEKMASERLVRNIRSFGMSAVTSRVFNPGRSKGASDTLKLSVQANSKLVVVGCTIVKKMRGPAKQRGRKMPKADASWKKAKKRANAMKATKQKSPSETKKMFRPQKKKHKRNKASKKKRKKILRWTYGQKGPRKKVLANWRLSNSKSLCIRRAVRANGTLLETD